MKSKSVRLAVSFLALTIGGLAASSQTQQPRPLGKEPVSFKFQNISVPGAAETDAYAINNKKEIAGVYFNAAGEQVGMFLKGKKVTSVSCPNGEPSVIFGVNSAGTGVADCGVSPGGLGPEDGYVIYVVENGHIVLVHTNCDCPTIDSLAINDSEVVAGFYQDSQQVAHAFMYDVTTSVFNSLDLPGGFEVEPTPNPWGLNNAGMMTLEGIDPASRLVHSFLFNGVSFTEIDVPNARQSFVHGINNNGDIVYTAQDATGNNWGVFFSADLQQFFWFNQPDGRDNTRAYGLNDEVVGPKSSKLRIVGEYSPPGSNQNNAYEAIVTIKP